MASPAVSIQKSGHKYRVLVSATIIQTCLGGIYAWSVFVPFLRADYDLSMKECQLLFGGSFVVFTGFMIVAGRLLSRYEPRVLAGLGGVLFGAGYYVASLSAGNFGILFLGIVLLTGMGIGLCYICSLTACVKWFQEKKGLATGIAVAGFGGGAIVLSNTASLLLTHGVDVLTVFRAIGGVYGGVIVFAACFLAFPKNGILMGPSQSQIPQRFYARRIFWILCAGIFSGSFSGLMIIGNLEPIGLTAGVPRPLALMAISMMAIGNAAGRIVWGWIFDRWGPNVIPVSLFLLGSASAGFLLLEAWPRLMPILSLTYGVLFGGCFVVYAGAVAHFWGSRAVGTIYPFVFLAYGLSGLFGPITAGCVFDLSGSYHMALVLALVLPVTVGSLLLRGGNDILKEQQDVQTATPHEGNEPAARRRPFNAATVIAPTCDSLPRS